GVEELDSAELTKRLSVCFDCQPAGQGPAAAKDVWKQIEELDDQGAFGLYTAKDQQWTLVTANSETDGHMQRIAGGQSDDWRGLGVAMLHGLIVDNLLGMKGHDKPTYVHLVQEVVDGLQGKLEEKLDYPLAALVMPATVD